MYCSALVLIFVAFRTYWVANCTVPRMFPFFPVHFQGIRNPPLDFDRYHLQVFPNRLEIWYSLVGDKPLQ